MLLAAAQALAVKVCDAGFTPADSPKAVSFWEGVDPSTATVDDIKVAPVSAPLTNQNTAISMYGAFYSADAVATALGAGDLAGRERLWNLLYESKPPSAYALFASFPEWEGATELIRQERAQ